MSETESEELLPGEPTAEEKNVMYHETVTSLMAHLAKPLEESLNVSTFAHPLPPTVGSMAVMQALVLLAIGIGRQGGLKLEHMRDVFQSSVSLAGDAYPDLQSD